MRKSKILSEIPLRTGFYLLALFWLSACSSLRGPAAKVGDVAADVGRGAVSVGKTAVNSAQNALGQVDGRGSTSSAAAPFNANLSPQAASTSSGAPRMASSSSTMNHTAQAPLAGQTTPLVEAQVTGSSTSLGQSAPTPQAPLAAPSGVVREGSGYKPPVGGSTQNEIMSLPSKGAAATERCPTGYQTISDPKRCNAASMCLRLPGGMTCRRPGG